MHSFRTQYITLDDIMDLMGSDALQSEEAMHRMWGDSIRAVKCQHARITYGDFLLLMKGQTREATPSQELQRDLESNVSNLMPVSGRPLHVLHEGIPDADSHATDATSPTSAIQKPSMKLDRAKTEGDVIALKPKAPLMMPAGENPALAAENSELMSSMPLRPTSPYVQTTSNSAPSTPADHKLILDVDENETPPFVKNVSGDVMSSGPGIPGTSASLTPPHSPVRGPRDYVTPMGNDRFTVSMPESVNNILIPGLPIEKPAQYTRRRSRSVDESENQLEAKDQGDLHSLADAVRDMIVPESGNFHFTGLEDVMKDESKSALQVNRQLYRAHRHMRLAVLEASKRFEEQQARHAREVLVAQKEKEEVKSTGLGMIHAGLVMRHGTKSQVSSEAIRKLLKESEAQQQVLVEMANRRGGRGRRSRKKTISDMSGMLNSMGAEDMGTIASKAAEQEAAMGTSQASKTSGDEKNGDVSKSETSAPAIAAAIAAAAGTSAAAVASVSDEAIAAAVAAAETPEPSTVVGEVRDPTVPGDFHNTVDPFGKQGKYGAAIAAWDSIKPK